MTQFDPVDIRLGAAIRARREELQITQAVLASHIGVTFQQVQKYERGVNRIAAARLVRIGEVLDMAASELLGESGGVDKPGARSLVQWFNQIENDEQRQALLALAKAMKTPQPA
jgi:transcriptional regulator with XRE-family HTH domain